MFLPMEQVNFAREKNVLTLFLVISSIAMDKKTKEPPTEGPYITEKGMLRKKVVQRLLLNVWDFAGQGKNTT